MSSVSALSSSAMPALEQMVSRLMAKVDGDQDGKFSLDEFFGAGQKMPGAAFESPRIEDIFNKIDADGDGSLTSEEVTSFTQKISEQVQASMLHIQEAFLSSLDKGNDKGGARSPLDTNEDGRVSLLEMMAGLLSQPGESGNSKSSNAKFLSELASSSYKAGGSSMAAALSTMSLAA